MLHVERFIAAAAFLVSVAVLLPAGAVRAEDPKHEIEAIYAKIDEAFLERDADFLVGLLATDFTLTARDGKTVDREHAAASIHQFLEALTDVETASTHIDGVEATGDAIVVTSTQRLKAHLDDSDGKPHVLEVTARSRDTWVHGRDGWATKHTDDLGQTTKLDGHPAR